MSQELIVERRDAVQWITINRPKRRNAVNEAVVRGIDAAIAAAVGDRDCRAITLTGTGDKAFCAGADLAKGVKGAAFDVDFSRPQHYFVDLFKRVQECTLPIIARVNGPVMAGGFGLFSCCDLAVATDDAHFGTPEVKIGVTPMMILPWMLRLLPPRKLQEMCLTGEPWSAQQALDMGLINYAVPRADLDDKLNWLLGRILDKSPTAIRLGKQASNAMRDMSLRDALEYAQTMVPIMSSTQDVQEGIASFREKRKPEWTGR